MSKKLLGITIFIALYAFPVSTIKAEEPIKILLVPGHDEVSWGAQYGTIKEASMNLAVAKRIYKILEKDKKFEVRMTRNDDGYTKEFAGYFSENKEDIIMFRDRAKEEHRKKIEDGGFTEEEAVPHNNASEDMSIVLYGINKWANENKMDAVLHIHFNDLARKTVWEEGEHTGFAVYMPDQQMQNADESAMLSSKIFLELKKQYSTSTYEKEVGGFVADQKLIALGSNETLADGIRAVLIEYGYIYEDIFRKYDTRHKAYDDMARLTAAGIKSYFSALLANNSL